MNKKAGHLRVEDVRRRNLHRIKNATGKQWKELAEALGIHPTRLHHLASGRRAGGEYAAFTEKEARKIEQKLRLPALSLDYDSKVSSVDRITDIKTLKSVEQAIIAALAATGRNDVKRKKRYQEIVEAIYWDAKDRGEVDAVRIGRLVGEHLRE